ncbi:MAG: alpha/beta hydrolase [Deltaproteobacteria bacterium]|nr:alpha/beta hydrolase [Deltaproteobacteria bacterium]
MSRYEMRSPAVTLQLAATTATSPASVGLVVLAQCGPSRLRSDIALLLEQRGLATVQLDLSSSGDDHGTTDAIADRLIEGIDEIRAADLHRGLPLGVFGARTGGSAALIAAARRNDLVSSIVCWSARSDLVGAHLARIRTPTMLIVGSRDTTTLRVTRDATRQMIAPHRVAVISGATGGLDEPGALDEVAATAGTWLLGHLRALMLATRAR